MNPAPAMLLYGIGEELAGGIYTAPTNPCLLY